MAGGKAKISSTKSKYHPDQKGFGSFIYDSEEGTCFGRTAVSWLKITVFYIIFYAFLSGFFVLNYWIFSQTLNDKSPRWELDRSIIGSNPGVGFRPQPDQDANAESSLIWYRRNDEKDSHFWYSQLKEIVEKTRAQPLEGTKNCSYANGEVATADASCRVDLSGLGVCDVQNNFGYRDGQPCILIKLNKIFAWEPDAFGLNKEGKYAGIDELKKELQAKVDEDDFPTELKSHIERLADRNTGNEASILKTVWLSCSGENVGDKENLPEGHMTYYPYRGIPGYYFPYLNQANYKFPFVMVHLGIPETSRHVLINLECRAWARNIKYDRTTRSGSVHFEIMVD